MTKHEAANLLQALVNSGAAYIRPSKRVVNALRLAIDALNETDRSQWIPCSKRMPEETDSMFAKFYGTDRWIPGMMRKRSDTVLITEELADGSCMVNSSRTNDGEWSVNKVIHPKVLAWMPFPEPYQPEPERHTGCTSDACPIEGVDLDDGK